jgi:hypothetical protein
MQADSNDTDAPLYYVEGTDGTGGENYCSDHTTYLTKVTNGDNTMNDNNINVAAEIRNAGLTPTERTLREYGLVNECGDITDRGMQAIWALLLKDKADDLALAITAAVKEQDSKKKNK